MSPTSVGRLEVVKPVAAQQTWPLWSVVFCNNSVILSRLHFSLFVKWKLCHMFIPIILSLEEEFPVCAPSVIFPLWVCELVSKLLVLHKDTKIRQIFFSVNLKWFLSVMQKWRIGKKNSLLQWKCFFLLPQHFAPVWWRRMDRISLDCPNSLPGFPRRLLSVPMENKYKCQQCLQVLRKPVQAQCGHRFCVHCFKQLTR